MGSSAPLLYVLEVTLRPLPVLGGLGAPPTAPPWLNFETPLGRLLSLDKGKGRVNLIKYPGGSEYLKSAVQHALTVGPRKVSPSYGATFSRRYRPPFGVRVWSLDILTFYVVSVPKMVCFFEVAFDNGFRFPLHPFIKGFCNTSMFVLLNSRPTVGVFWSACWSSLGTGDLVSPV